MDDAPMIVTPGPVGPGLSRQELAAVRARRAGLRRAVAAAREALAAPAEGGRGPLPGPLEEALAQLERVWAEHTAGTESPHGVLAQVVADCPRLAPAVERLRAEHATVAAGLAAARTPGDPGGTPAAPGLAALLDAVDRHRRAGRDLLHEAYQVDLGLGG